MYIKIFMKKLIMKHLTTLPTAWRCVENNIVQQIYTTQSLTLQKKIK